MRKAWLAVVLVLVGSVPFVGGCGQVCIAGMGNCDVYRNWTTASPTTTGAGQFQLTAFPASLRPGDYATVKLTTTNPRTTSAGCDWKQGDPPNVSAASFAPDNPPAANSLCSAQLRAGDTGTITVKVTERTSGAQILVNIPVSN